MEEWLCAAVKTPPPAAGGVSYFLFDLGAGAVWEDTPDSEGRVVLKASFPKSQAMSLMTLLPRALRRTAEAFEIPAGAFELSLELLAVEDYSEVFRAEQRPIKVSGSLILTPSFWEGGVAEHFGLSPYARPKILKIDPGAAFGSGRHPTTFLCLKILSDLSAGGFSPQKALDVGAGSGILALAAALLFPQADIMGVDSDPDTIEVALANRALNGLPDSVAFSGSPLSSLSPGYALIMANLTLNPLTEMAPRITSLAAPGCALIISGLLSGQAAEAAAAYENEGWSWRRHLGQGDWSALSLELGEPGAARPEPPQRSVVPEPSLETALSHED
jgi:ribosomal protein L11 methyltransferase